jgi:hypothetical protein
MFYYRVIIGGYVYNMSFIGFSMNPQYQIRNFLWKLTIFKVTLSWALNPRYRCCFSCKNR